MLRYLLLDLDNTLYSESYGLEHEVFRRMTDYTATFLGLSREEAVARRRSRMALYGTTLEWLMSEHGFTEIEDFFATVHPAGEEEPLSADPALARVLDSIDLPKAIFTNAPMEHATRFLDRMAVSDRFEAIYDIRFNNLAGKPRRDAILRVCAACGMQPSECLFVDDVPRYVQGFIDAGGRGYLFDEVDKHHASCLPRIHSLIELAAIVADEKLGPTQQALF